MLFSRKCVHNVLTMGNNLNDSGHKVSERSVFHLWWILCGQWERGLQVKNGHSLVWGSWLILREFHSSHISDKKGSWMEFLNLFFFLLKNSKLSLKFFQSFICKTLVLSLKTHFVSSRCDMNLERHWRSNLERNSDKHFKTCRIWAAKYLTRDSSEAL